MTRKIYKGYKPDYAVPPGETLSETIEAIDMSQAELARRTDRPVKTISDIINGKTQITPETALQFENVLNVPANFWLKLEYNYREALARLKEKEELENQLGMLKNFPVRELVKWKVFPPNREKSEYVKSLLALFQVDRLEYIDNIYSNAQIAYKQSNAHKINSYALYLWLRLGEIEGNKINCLPYDAKIFRNALTDIKQLIGQDPEIFIPELKQKCADCGVSVVFMPEIKGCRTFGAAKWINPNKALIILSNRMSSDDHLWFSFYHEAAHIMLHGVKDVFIDLGIGESNKEQEADDFAANFLISPKDYNQFKSSKITADSITHFAKAQNVSPGIVVGRLQHDNVIPFKMYTSLKRFYTWSE